MPRVSVILAAHNAETTITSTLQSLAASRMKDFEAIIVNDASTDTTREILDAFAARDRRFRILENAENRGLAFSLNRAIDHADSAYLARLDADDMDLPDRLQVQAAFLDRNPGVAVVGMGRYSISKAGALRKYHPPNCPGTCIAWQLNWGVPFAHPTVMLRRRDLDEAGIRYDATLPVAQDYDLWSRFLPGRRGANLMRPGILYRIHARQASRTRRDMRLNIHGRISAKQLLSVLGTPVDLKMIEAQRATFLSDRSRFDDTPQISEVIEFRQYICEQMLIQSTSDNGVKLGFGRDLLKLLQSQNHQPITTWLLRDKFRRACMVLALPYFAMELSYRAYQKLRITLA